MAGKLLREMGNPQHIFDASLTELEGPARRCGAGHSLKGPLNDAAKELAAAQSAGCKLLTWDEPEYPALLREIYEPPPLLYVLGNIELLSKHLISIVALASSDPLLESNGRTSGARPRRSRNRPHQRHGSRNRLLAPKGALSSAGGATIGVPGSGIEVVYPKENKKIFADMQSRDAIISEFLMGTFPAPQNFPIRNRIIAGIALGVVVVEGAQYSGCLISARLAMEFGREAFGVPGKATQPTSFGPNHLIKQGAKLVTTWEDVIEELPTPVRAELLAVESASAEQRAALLDETFVPSERTLYELLNVDQARHVDEIMEVSGLTSSEGAGDSI